MNWVYTRFSYICVSADYHLWGYKQRTYETTGTDIYIYYMYVEKFAYTSSNAEFRQDSESGIINRLYRWTFSRYITQLPFWVCDPPGDSHTEGQLYTTTTLRHFHQSLWEFQLGPAPHLYFKGSGAHQHGYAVAKSYLQFGPSFTPRCSYVLAQPGAQPCKPQIPNCS